jgi:2-iminobutanoate/2-iminopropanoate deaminase
MRKGEAMKKEILAPKELCPSLGIYSHAVKVQGNSLLFISGTTARDKNGNIVGKGDIKAQTQKILENIKIILDNAGATFDNIVKVTVFIRDMAHFKDIHEIRAKFFKKDFPASTLVQVSKLYSEDILIEMEAVAVL